MKITYDLAEAKRLFKTLYQEKYGNKKEAKFEIIFFNNLEIASLHYLFYKFYENNHNELEKSLELFQNYIIEKIF